MPKKGTDTVMSMLHQAHPGISRMKSLARSYVWWPGVDKDLEQRVKSCDVCQQSQKSPPVISLHPWSWPSKPWTRVHIDYAGPFMGRMFLLVIDAHTKWLEVHPTSVTTSTATITLLRRSFATFRLPAVVVSDNAANFTSEEFKTFLTKNGVKHVRTPPYHPASNGLVERAVQTFKGGMKKLREGSLETKVSRFLFSYRLTPQSSTGVSPSELMFGRRLRSQFDNLKPSLEKKDILNQERQRKAHDSHARHREFKVDDRVYVKNYSTGNTWLPGKVTKKLGSAMYAVLLEDGRNVRKHGDQMRSRTDSNEQVDDSVGMDSDDSFDMRVPSTNNSNDIAADTNERNDSSDVASDTNERNDSSDVSDESDELESPRAPSTVDVQEQEPESSGDTTESPDPPTLVRRSDRNRKLTDFYGMVRT